MDQVVPGGSGTRIELNLSAVGLVSFDFPEDVPRGKVIEFTIKSTQRLTLCGTWVRNSIVSALDDLQGHDFV